jgi:hypothetical protein
MRASLLAAEVNNRHFIEAVFLAKKRMKPGPETHGPGIGVSRIFRKYICHKTTVKIAERCTQDFLNTGEWNAGKNGLTKSDA